MPAATDGAGLAPSGTQPASVRRDGDVLRFAGVLARGSVPALWQQLPPLDGVRRIDVGEVASVDSAGLALLGEVVERSGASEVEGMPAGLAELRSAYRLHATLGFGDA